MPPSSAPEAVRVAVQTRPLLPSELSHNATSCLTILPGRDIAEPASGRELLVNRPSRAPTQFSDFDSVHSPDSDNVTTLYDVHVPTLLDSLFEGINVTVLAYGQTSAGKTYTMRSVTDRVIDDIFQRRRTIERMGERNVTIRVGYVEIYRESIKDLVEGGTAPNLNIQVRERRLPDGTKAVFLDGAREKQVTTPEELHGIVRDGMLVRQTAATGMNAASSRSHGVITVTVQQEMVDNGAVCVVAKLHLVDLAGSERVTRTASRAGGARFAEGVDINKGLFALAKVISALADMNAAKQKPGQIHVPYRDSKLTRLLQDSLGGNARTLLIACVSPADSSREETLGTLRYAARAKCIRNKPRVNVDANSVEVSDLRASLARARAEIVALVKENEALRRGQRRTSGGGMEMKESKLERGHGGALRTGSSDLGEKRNSLRYVENGPIDRTPSPTTSSESASENGSRRPARRRTRPPLRANNPAVRGMGSRSASERILPARRDGDEENDLFDDKCIIDARARRKASDMKCSLMQRIQQAETDKKSIDEERLKLMRKVSFLQKKHEKEIEDIKATFQLRVNELRSRLADVKKLEAESTRMTKMRDGSDAARKRMATRLRTAEKSREEVVTRLADALAKIESVKASLGREIREFGKNERVLKSELAKVDNVNTRQKVVIQRLRMENEALRGRRGKPTVRRANSAFAPTAY